MDALMILAVVFAACGLVVWCVVRWQEKQHLQEIARLEAASAERAKQRAEERRIREQTVRIVQPVQAPTAQRAVYNTIANQETARLRQQSEERRRRREDADDNVSEMRDRHNAMMASQAASWYDYEPSRSSSSCSSRSSHSHDSGSSSSSSCDNSSSSSDSGSCSASCD